MSEITGGELLARCLANEGIKFVFGLPSPEIDPLLAQLGAHDIRLFPVRHEAAGVHMAEGLYKTTGQVAVVLGNPGPGSANLLPGVITARHEGVPVLAITSQHRLGIVYPSPPSTFQGQDQLDVFKPAVKWGGPILSWERIPEVVRLAFREMWTGRPGPVHIELPAPVLYATGDERGALVLPPSAYRPPPPQASDAQLREAAACSPARGRRWWCRARASTARAPTPRCSHWSTARLPGDHDHGRARHGARRPPQLRLRLRAERRCREARRRRHSRRRLAARQPRDPVRQVLGRCGAAAADPDRPRPAQHGRHPTARARHRRRRARSARGAGAHPGGDVAGRARRPPCGASIRQPQAWWDAQLAPVADWKGPGIHPAQAMRIVGATFGRDAVYVTDGGNTSLWAIFLPATDAAALVPQHLRARHARHRHSLRHRRQARRARARGGVRDR